jgi:hypothetical protein
MLWPTTRRAMTREAVGRRHKNYMAQPLVRALLIVVSECTTRTARQTASSCDNTAPFLKWILRSTSAFNQGAPSAMVVWRATVPSTARQDMRSYRPRVPSPCPPCSGILSVSMANRGGWQNKEREIVGMLPHVRGTLRFIDYPPLKEIKPTDSRFRYISYPRSKSPSDRATPI